MYLVMFTTFNVCVINFISGKLDWRYGFFLGGCNVVGSLIGLYFSDRYVQKTGKQSAFVFILGVVFLLSVAINPYVAYIEMSLLI